MNFWTSAPNISLKFVWHSYYINRSRYHKIQFKKYQHSFYTKRDFLWTGKLHLRTNFAKNTFTSNEIGIFHLLPNDNCWLFFAKFRSHLAKYKQKTYVRKLVIAKCIIDVACLLKPLIRFFCTGHPFPVRRFDVCVWFFHQFIYQSIYLFNFSVFFDVVAVLFLVLFGFNIFSLWNLSLQLTKFTKMNVWTHYVFWNGEYPNGPNDIVCRKSQQKKRNETATAYQQLNIEDIFWLLVLIYLMLVVGKGHWWIKMILSMNVIHLDLLTWCTNEKRIWGNTKFKDPLKSAWIPRSWAGTGCKWWVVKDGLFKQS